MADRCRSNVSRCAPTASIFPGRPLASGKFSRKQRSVCTILHLVLDRLERDNTWSA